MEIKIVAVCILPIFDKLRSAMMTGMFLLLFLLGSTLAEDELRYHEELLTPVTNPRFLNSVVNLTNFNIFNNTLFLYGGIIILGIVLFELALYALDVYYNQTYLGAGGQGFAYGYNEKKDDLEPGLYQLYYDPFQTTYRAINNWDFNMSKIVGWIHLLQETWNVADSTFNDLECQKRAVCEVWQDKDNNKLGFFNGRVKRSLRALEVAEDLDLPDDLLSVIDDFREARETGEGEKEEPCGKVYDCNYSILDIVKLYNNI